MQIKIKKKSSKHKTSHLFELSGAEEESDFYLNDVFKKYEKNNIEHFLT